MLHAKKLVLLFGCLPLLACQQPSSVDRVAPAPLVEQIDPQTDPVKAVRAHQQQQSVALADVGQLRAEVLKLTRDKSADNVQQCLVLGLGHKPCGGPAEYIAVSTKGRDEGALLKKISAYNQAVEAENMRKGMMSDCSVVMKPQVQLNNGQCELVKELTQ
ncbi:hypothetical protein LMJ53_02910 [Rheinheimera sp. UJ51]|uniref:hypothetical protein n=1 Tax=unclassified Rheinheimera TaxID=115860 RepID=UPI001E37C2FD|nr:MULTISPECIES: hypothetical protein [unclassified Rheinheimera]MCC5450685.1 hypothetical protein [Rheinheimera sp. UJ51]MCF4008612.1 hypothetical protein [Rheinheimera sp. UJ63]